MVVEWVMPGERYARAQQLLTEYAGHPALLKPLATWVSPHDRHLPRALLPLPLGELLATPLEDLLARRGIGHLRISRLLDVLDRAAGQLARERDGPPPAGPELPPPGPLDPDEMTDERWERWCAVVHGHGLEDEPLGRYAARLVDLQHGLWTLPLREYTGRPLCDIRNLPTHGPARLAQVFGVVGRLARALGSPPPSDGLRLGADEANVRAAAQWVGAALRDGRAPAAAEVRERLVAPLLRQLEQDMAADALVMVGRRIGLDAPAETLDAIATDAGLTRERVRQLTARAAEVFAVRWPEARFVLADFAELLRAAPGGQAAVDGLRGLLDVGFDVRDSHGHSRTEVLAGWEREGRARRTPMAEPAVRAWLATDFPRVPPDAALDWLTAAGHRANDLYFSGEPADRLLRHLHATGGAVEVAAAREFLPGGERNVRLRLERDARFIEDEHHRYHPAEGCGIFRRGGEWYVQLTTPPGRTEPPRAAALAVRELVPLLLGGLVGAGVCDATVWGVHRHAGAALRAVYGAALTAAVTPFVLGATLVRHSDGRVRTMRRRRLRWDAADGSVPVRGKRGWVDFVVERGGVPLTTDELDRGLRAYFQDYEGYVLRMLDADDDEDGGRAHRYRIVHGASGRLPVLVLPGDWELDAACGNVSEGVRALAARVVAASARAPYPKAHLRRLPWMVRLCEHVAGGPVRWADEPADQGL